MIFTRTSRKYKNILYARSDFRKLAEYQPDDLFCTESGKGTEADLLQSGRNLRSAEGRTQRDENLSVEQLTSFLRDSPRFGSMT